MGGDAVVLVLVGAYAGVGTVWLMLSYWAGLRIPAAGDARAHPRPPWPALVAVLLVVVGMLGLGSLGPRRVAQVLAELLPTSGGSQGYDPAARGGVNDGDDEVRGLNAKSVGFAESDVFLEDDRPSLYDAVSDMYGEPFTPKKQERHRSPCAAASRPAGPPAGREPRWRPGIRHRAGKVRPSRGTRPTATPRPCFSWSGGRRCCCAWPPTTTSTARPGARETR